MQIVLTRYGPEQENRNGEGAMTIYRLFLWTGDERSARWNEAVCDNDQEARDLAQHMLDEWGGPDSQAEVWAGSRLAGMVFSMSSINTPMLESLSGSWLA